MPNDRTIASDDAASLLQAFSELKVSASAFSQDSSQNTDAGSSRGTERSLDGLNSVLGSKEEFQLREIADKLAKKGYASQVYESANRAQLQVVKVKAQRRAIQRLQRLRLQESLADVNEDFIPKGSQSGHGPTVEEQWINMQSQNLCAASIKESSSVFSKSNGTHVPAKIAAKAEQRLLAELGRYESRKDEIRNFMLNTANLGGFEALEVVPYVI